MKILKGDKWYYHPEHGAALMWRSDENEHYSNGWCDSPDDFEKKDKTQLKDSDIITPGELTIENMDKKEIEEFARKQYGVELDRRKTRENMIKDLDKALEVHYG